MPAHLRVGAGVGPGVGNAGLDQGGQRLHDVPVRRARCRGGRGRLHRSRVGDRAALVADHADRDAGVEMTMPARTTGRTIAYCRVSHRDQNPQLQLDALQTRGYDLLFEEKISSRLRGETR